MSTIAEAGSSPWETDRGRSDDSTCTLRTLVSPLAKYFSSGFNSQSITRPLPSDPQVSLIPPVTLPYPTLLLRCNFISGPSKGSLCESEPHLGHSQVPSQTPPPEISLRVHTFLELCIVCPNHFTQGPHIPSVLIAPQRPRNRLPLILSNESNQSYPHPHFSIFRESARSYPPKGVGGR